MYKQKHVTHEDVKEHDTENKLLFFAGDFINNLKVTLMMIQDHSHAV